jgi:hypothetical protein
MKYKAIILILCFHLFSCNNKKTVSVDLDNYEKLEIKDNNLSVILIKTFPNENKCSGTILNSNLYLCQDFETNDTIMVFEPCSEVPDFAENNFSGERDLAIEKKDIIKYEIKNINVVLEDTTILNKKYKYVLGSLTSLVY